MLKANFHTHTTFCDGSDSPEAVAKYAFTGGMSHLGFSGHMDADIHMDWPSYVKEIRRLKDLYVGRMDIFLGVELDTLYDPGSICGEDGLPEAEYIIGSTHFLDVPSAVPMSVDSSPEQMEALCREFFEEDGFIAETGHSHAVQLLHSIQYHGSVVPGEHQTGEADAVPIKHLLSGEFYAVSKLKVNDLTCIDFSVQPAFSGDQSETRQLG